MHNLAAIGYKIGSLEEFQNLADEAFEKGKHFRAGRNEYIRFRDVSGAELWVQQDEELEITGMLAFYDAQHWIEVELLHAIAFEDRPLDGAFEAQALVKDSQSAHLLADGTSHKFCFDLPDAHTVPKVALPAKAKLQLCAFANEMTYFPSQAAFSAANPGALTQNISNAANPDGTDLSSEMQMTGEVLEAQTLHNTHSGNDFFWILVQTPIGAIELVASSETCVARPEIGQILHGKARFVGRVVLDQAVPLKPGIFERLFWGASTNTRQ